MTSPVMVEANRAHQPAATAAAAAKRAVERAELIEEIEWMLAAGEPAGEIAKQLNARPGTIARRLERAGRPDLAVPFERARDRRWS